MRKPYTLVLCEDIQTETFVRLFLFERGWKKYNIRPRIAPRGKGSAEQWVRKEFVQDLKEYRARSNHTLICLIAVIDADAHSVQDRLDDFRHECHIAGINYITDTELVAIIIPKRNIETWLHYLKGKEVNDTDTYKKYPTDRPGNCKPQVLALNQMCRNGRMKNTPPDSLVAACQAMTSILNLS